MHGLTSKDAVFFGMRVDAERGGRAVPAPAGVNFEASGYDPDVRVNRDVQLQRRSRMPRQAPSTLLAATSHEILYVER